MWVLVYILVNVNGEAQAINAGGRHKYSNMYDCFEARENLAVTVGGKSGHFPTSTQGICVYIGEQT